jgi:hypothetical protein
MKNEEYEEHSKDRRHHDGHKRKEHSHHRGAKTFRRGRAIAFLEMMNLKRSTIKQQLEKPEFQSINQILVGELKAMDLVINEFIQLFEIQESEIMETHNMKSEETAASVMAIKEPLGNDEEGIDLNETN